MANAITGRIHRITPEQTITGKSGKTFTKRTLILDAVTVSYDINGREFKDEQTGEVKYFNTIRGYKVEPYGKRDDLPPSAPAGSTATKAPVAQPQDGEEKSDLPF